jgi:hypothetical protein
MAIRMAARFWYLIAVHVDGFEESVREILLFRGRQLGDEEVEEDRQLLSQLAFE